MDNDEPEIPPRAFILGGNASTLAYASSLRAENRQIAAWLVPLAWTPAGVVVGERPQRVTIAADNVGGWVDQTFPPEDDRSFVGSMRDLEMLLRIGWGAPLPERLREEAIVNPEDLPEDVLDGLDEPTAAVVQCAICRRTCVRDDFTWNDRQLCAWDYHATVFGKRGPWRGVPYEERLFETLPKAPYVSPALLHDAAVDVVMTVTGLPESAQRALVNGAIEAGGEASYLAVRVVEGYTLLRERTGR